MSEWSRICCAVDFGEPSRMAMGEATELARRLGAELSVVHVVTPQPPVMGEILVGPTGTSTLDVAEAEARLALWRVEAEAEAGVPVTTRLLAGEPAHEIARYADGEHVGIVVVGTHGRTGLRHLVAGSVAERVVRACHCPVLVVHDGAARARRHAAEETGQYV